MKSLTRHLLFAWMGGGKKDSYTVQVAPQYYFKYLVV